MPFECSQCYDLCLQSQPGTPRYLPKYSVRQYRPVLAISFISLSTLESPPHWGEVNRKRRLFPERPNLLVKPIHVLIHQFQVKSIEDPSQDEAHFRVRKPTICEYMYEPDTPPP